MKKYMYYRVTMKTIISYNANSPLHKVSERRETQRVTIAKDKESNISKA